VNQTPSTDATLQVDVVSAHGLVWSGVAQRLSVPAIGGEIGILPRHSPLLAPLQPGELRIHQGADGESIDYLYVDGGFVEIQPDRVIVLADTALRSQDLDEAAAQHARQQAERALSAAVLYRDRDRARLLLQQAIAQLQTLQNARRQQQRRTVTKKRPDSSDRSGQ